MDVEKKRERERESRRGDKRATAEEGKAEKELFAIQDPHMPDDVECERLEWTHVLRITENPKLTVLM